MPTPPLDPEEYLKVIDAWRETGQSVERGAKLLNMPYSRFKSRLGKAKADGLHLSPGARNVIDRARLSYGEAQGGWIHDYDADGKKIGTTRWSVPADELSDDTLERIKTAFVDMPPSAPVAAPEAVLDDLCTVYPIMDAHVGMHAWGRETGGDDYDLKHAAQDMRHAFAKVLAITPASRRAVLLVGGDYFHSDDTRAETPASKHKLDMDGRFFKVIDVGIGILAETVNRLLRKHEDVLVKVLRGNHDPHSHLTLTFALSERYRDDPRVTVDKDPRDLFMHQWGKCAIFAHHGDKGKPQQMALYLSDVCPFWSEARHRHYFTGHVHHDQARDYGPLRWESLRAFCPPDAYAASMGYGGRRALQSITFHRQDGLVLRALDPIERAA